MTGSTSPTAAQMFLAAVGEQILAYRETAGLNQADVAERVRIGIEQLDQIEHGWFDPSLTLMQAIAAVLGATVHELLDIEGTELGRAAAQAMKRG